MNLNEQSVKLIFQKRYRYVTVVVSEGNEMQLKIRGEKTEKSQEIA